MKRPSTYRERRGDLGTMTPMIDVVFLLLIFFVWTASFQIVEQVLPSRLSVAQGSQPTNTNEPPPPEADFDQVVIRILRTETGPQWQINDTDIANLTDLRQRLKSIAEVKQDAPVILFPDPEAPLGDVIDVYDLARLEDFQKVNFAVRDQG